MIWSLSIEKLEHKLGTEAAGDAARRLGCSSRQVIQKFRDRGIGPRRAEELAVAAGFLPEEIWGEAWQWSEDALLEWQKWNGARRWVTRREIRLPWPDNYEFPRHSCAVDGCNCVAGRVV